MKTLITGASGFIGSHLLRELQSRGEDIRILLLEGSNLSNIEELTQSNVEWFYGDLLQPESCRKALEGCDKVYHLAGLVSTSPHLKAQIKAINYTACINLFEACMDADLTKIVYLASIFALAKGTKDKPADENTPYNLSNWPVPYFRAKRQAELASYKFLEKGLPLVHVYPCFCMGPGDLFLSSGAVIADFLNKKVPAYINGGLNIIDVRDAAHALVLGMDKGTVGDKYLAGDHDITFKAFFDVLARVSGLRPPKLKIPKRVGMAAGWLAEKISKRPPIDYFSAMLAGDYWYYDSSKAQRELGLKGRRLEDTLGDAVGWFQDHGFVR